MSPTTLAAWQERLGLTKSEACSRLGLSRTTYDAYLSGKSKIPLYIALACAALAFGLPPMA